MVAMAALIVVVVVTGWAVEVEDGVVVVVAVVFVGKFVSVDDVAAVSDFWLGNRMAYDGGGSISS